MSNHVQYVIKISPFLFGKGSGEPGSRLLDCSLSYHSVHLFGGGDDHLGAPPPLCMNHCSIHSAIVNLIQFQITLYSTTFNLIKSDHAVKSSNLATYHSELSLKFANFDPSK